MKLSQSPLPPRVGCAEHARSAIAAEGLRKRYGDTEALGGLDLTVEAGTVHGLLGPNGAGKTTAVRILTTLVRADGGHAWVDGFDVDREPDAVRRRIGLVGQHAAVDELLSGRQNLILFGRLYHLGAAGAARRGAELLERLGLADAGRKPVRQYSGGMRRRLDLAISLILSPAVLLMDEPTTGLDPRGRAEVWEAVRALVADGTTVLLTTQYLDEADQLADQISVVDSGRVVASGTPAALKARLGADRIHVVPRHRQDLPATLAAVRSVASAEPAADPDTRLLSAPVRDRVGALTELARTLHDNGIEVEDLGVRRPTLDEVFLHLTSGEPANPRGHGQNDHHTNEHDPDHGPNDRGPNGHGPDGRGPDGRGGPNDHCANGHGLSGRGPNEPGLGDHGPKERGQNDHGAEVRHPGQPARHGRTELARMGWALADGWTMTGRNLAHWTRQPVEVLIGLLFPVMIVLMFGYLLGGGMAVPGTEPASGDVYREFLLPGAFAMTMLFGLETTFSAVATDASRGVTDRFRSMPMSGLAVVVGRAVADLLYATVGLTFMVICGVLVGWGWHGDTGTALAAFGLLLLLRFSLVWVGIYLGLVAPGPQAVVAVQILVWPMSFLSNVFVSPGTMPGWLGTVAAWNPLSATVAATRDLFANPGWGAQSWPAAHALPLAVAWPVLLIAVFLPLSVRRYRRLT